MFAGGGQVLIEFRHYKTFQDAKEKWDERKKRIDFSNLFIILSTPDSTEEFQREFDNLPYTNKLLITNANLIDSPSVCVAEVFNQPDLTVGKIFKYKTKYSLKRHMDDIDYISYLNRMHE